MNTARLAKFAGRERRLLEVSGAAGVLFLIALCWPTRDAWAAYLMGFFFFVCLGLAGCLFLAVIALSRADWALPLRRVPEAMASTLPAAGASGSRPAPRDPVALPVVS